MAFQPVYVTIPLGDPGADNKQIYAVEATSDAQGGGMTLVQAKAVNGATIASGAGGTTFTLALHKYSSAGTPAVNGTIAAAVGGTAEGWASGVPKAFTIDSDYAFLDAGEWLVVQYNEVNAGNPTAATLNLIFQVGR